MTESSSQNPSSPEITPKEEPVTLDKPKSPNPFLPASQVEFPFDEISFTTNNECLGGKRGGMDQISNKDATILYSLANGVKVDYAKIICEDIIHKINKKTREKVVPYPRFISYLLEYMMPKYDNEELTINPTQVFSVHNWALKPNLTKGPSFIDHMKAIYNLDVLVESKAPKPSSQTEEVPQGKNLGAKMVGEMHKEAQQAAGSPTSLGATREEGAHPQLSSGTNPSVLVDQTKSAGDRLKTAHTDSDESEEEETKKKEDTHATSHDIPEDTLKEKLEQQKAKAKEEVASLKARPSYPDINQLTEFCLPTELKELPSKFTELSGYIKELKKHVRDMELELPGDLKEILTKLETFTSTISRLTSQVAELKNIQWELPNKFLDLPSQISLVQKKLQTLDSLPSLLNKVTETLNRFATMVENTSGATTMDVPSAGQATASPAEGEKNTNPTTKNVEPNLHDELVYLLGIDVVTQYYNKKLLYDKYCDKMLKRRKRFKITNFSDLHLVEWREVVQACPDRKEKGWKTIYGLIKIRMEYLDQIEKELKIDLNKPLKEQDPLNELNDLANKKRKRTDDSTDHPTQQKKQVISST
ncbi:hypothetical protein Tco_1338298 [Tanacetum coccineum]